MELAKIQGSYKKTINDEEVLSNFTGFVIKRNEYIEGLVADGDDHKYIIGLTFNDGGIAFYMLTSDAKEKIAFLGVKENLILRSNVYDTIGMYMFKKDSASIKFEMQNKNKKIGPRHKTVEEIINAGKDSIEVYKGLHFCDSPDFKLFWDSLIKEKFQQMKSEYSSTLLKKVYKEPINKRLIKIIFPVLKH